MVSVPAVILSCGMSELKYRPSDFIIILVQVNGHNLVDGHHQEAVEALKKSGSQVFVKVSREVMLTVGMPTVSYLYIVCSHTARVSLSVCEESPRIPGNVGLDVCWSLLKRQTTVSPPNV